jgi:divalent metal cation (Fe/Co/Zn/Cd) transporter
LIGVIAQVFTPGWWWIDSVTSLSIVVLLVKEGREAWRGKESKTTE